MKTLRSIAGGLLMLAFGVSQTGTGIQSVHSQVLPVPPPVQSVPHPHSNFQTEDSGSLQVVSPDGKKLLCPLEHTDVQAAVSGYVARVTVKQEFANPFKEKIEALYTFPLPDTAAVDAMTMRIGTRTIRGAIKKREEAHQIYEQAKQQGHVAALLDQERPNIFTQSVANIEPGKNVEVTLSYVDLLPYESGNYTFAFPTVVGPRFNPGEPSGESGHGFSPDTAEVPDASRITPHVAPSGVRAGHDISIRVSIDSGIPLSNVHSQLHEVNTTRPDGSHAIVSLVNKERIPNRDFVLTWSVAADKLHSGYLTNGKNGSGYFTVMVMPPKKPSTAQVQPKEMIFLIDCSGSQSGRPLEKAKQVMRYSLEHMNPDDTFQVITFNSAITKLFAEPRRATPQMRNIARDFVDSLQARGGTWMAPAVEAACKLPADEHRLRIVSFMTDGFVGNDFEIIGMVRKLRDKSRWFPFGTGSSVNRFLIDSIASEGGGEADYVYLNSPADEAGKKFYDKIAFPVLSDIKVSFDGVQVKDVFPHQVSDVWAQKPLYITGRYLKPGSGTITISGFSGGKPYAEKLPVNFPQNNTKNEVLGSIWARAKVDRLMSEDYAGAQKGSVNAELKDEIVKVALQHHIMTQYTSFVAVEEKTVTQGGVSKTVDVPVELPEGESREGVFGELKPKGKAVLQAFGGRFQYAASQRSAFNGPVATPGAFAPAPPAVTACSIPGPVPQMVSAAGGGRMSQTATRVARKNMYADKSGTEETTTEKIDEKAALAKLSPALQKLAHAKVDINEKSFGDIKLEHGRLRVKVALHDTPTMDLFLWGGEIEEVVVADKVAYVLVNVNRLLRLASHADVVHVDVANAK